MSCLPISKFSSFLSNPVRAVPRVLITSVITVVLMFHRFFFNSLTKSKDLSLISFSFIFTLWSAGTAKHVRWGCFQFLCLSRVLVVEPGLSDPFVSLNPSEFYVSFSRTDSGLCMYCLVVWSNFNFFHNFQWSCHVLNKFCASLLHLCWFADLSYFFTPSKCFLPGNATR